MPGNKEHPINIIIRAIDKATAPMRAINARIEGLVGPARRINNQFRAMALASGVGKVFERAKGVSSAAGAVVGQVKGLSLALLGLTGISGGTAFGLFTLTRHVAEIGDRLAKTSARVGLTVNAFSEWQFVAERAGISNEEFAGSMDIMNRSIGQAKAGMGPLAAFLNMVSPALYEQVIAAKSNAEAMDLLVGAMARIEDPAKRAAFAAAAFGRSGMRMANLVKGGVEGVNELRGEFRRLAGDQEKFARTAERMSEGFTDFMAAFGGLRSAAFAEIFPALTDLLKTFTEFLVSNREGIAAWAKDFAVTIPAKLKSLSVEIIGLWETFKPFLATGWEVIKFLAQFRRTFAVLAAVIIGFKLIAAIYALASAFVALGVAILTTPVGWLLGAVALIAGGAYLLIHNWEAVSEFFSAFWAKFGDLILLTVAAVGGPIGWIIAAAGLLIKHWEPVKAFFADAADLILRSWEPVSKFFSGLWEIVKNVADYAGRFIHSGVGIEMEGMAPALGATEFGGAGGIFARNSVQRSQAQVSISFENAPRGTRAKADPRNTAELDLSMGYAMTEAIP